MLWRRVGGWQRPVSASDAVTVKLSEAQQAPGSAESVTVPERQPLSTGALAESSHVRHELVS